MKSNAFYYTTRNKLTRISKNYQTIFILDIIKGTFPYNIRILKIQVSIVKGQVMDYNALSGRL